MVVWDACSLDGKSLVRLDANATSATIRNPFDCVVGGNRHAIEAAEFLECDYERNCTPLYRAIEDEDWEFVLHFLNKGFWPGNFFYDSTPAADQARTWVTRYEGGGGGDSADQVQVVWSHLPMHLCCILNAPYGVVSRLLEIYPAAARSLDDQTNLPLHIALRHGASDRIVDQLLISFPEAVNVKGKGGLTPLECAEDKTKVRGRVFRAIFGLDGGGSSLEEDLADQSSYGVGNITSAVQTVEGSPQSVAGFFDSISRTFSEGSCQAPQPLAAAATSASALGSVEGKDLKASFDDMRLNSLEYNTHRELAELRKELKAVSSMADSRADLDELKSEIRNLRRQLRAKEHTSSAAAQPQPNSKGKVKSKSKDKNKSSITGILDRPRNSLSRLSGQNKKQSGKKAHVTKTYKNNARPGVGKSMSLSKSSEHMDHSDSVSICSSVVSSRNQREYEVSMLPQVSMLDDDSSDDDDDDDSDEETDSLSETDLVERSPNKRSNNIKKKKKKKVQLEKRRKSLQQKKKKKNRQRQRQRQQQDDDIYSEKTGSDLQLLHHHSRPVASRRQCVIS